MFADPVPNIDSAPSVRRGAGHDDSGLYLLVARRHGAGHADRLRPDHLRRRADDHDQHVRCPDRGAERHQWRRQLSADGDSVLHAGRRADEQGRAGQAHRQCRPRRRRASARRARLRHHSRLLHPGVAVGLGRGRCRRPGGAAGADDGGRRPQEGLCGRPRRRRRHHRPGDSAQHRLCHFRRRCGGLDLKTVPGRNLSRA